MHGLDSDPGTAAKGPVLQCHLDTSCQAPPSYLGRKPTLTNLVTSQWQQRYAKWIKSLCWVVEEAESRARFNTLSLFPEMRMPPQAQADQTNRIPNPVRTGRGKKEDICSTKNTNFLIKQAF